MPQTLADIKALLAARGLRPKHRHGQNFLHDANKMREILDAAEISGGDLILEVGPGTGALSDRLLEANARLVAVEIDPDMASILEPRFAQFPDRATLILGDALDGKHNLNPRVIAELANAAGLDTTSAPATPASLPNFKLVANLPYHIASPLLANLAVDYPGMSLAIVMVQDEVGDRLAAPPGGKDYGPLTIIVQAMCAVDRVATLSPACFWPQPGVDSVVLRMRRRTQPLTDDPAALSMIVHKLFNQRRKQLGSVLGRNITLPPGIDLNMRPEQLSVAQFVELSRLFKET